MSRANELGGIWGGLEVVVVELYGLDVIHLLKEERVPEVAVSPRSWWNMLAVVIMKSNGWNVRI